MSSELHIINVNEPYNEVEDEEGNSSSGDSDSIVSSCPSWALEDLEGIDDDDILFVRPPDHSRKVWECVRKYVNDKKQKRKEARDVEKTLQIRQNDEWYSDGEKEELKEEEGFEWSENVDMQIFELAAGQKFPDRKTFQKVVKDWAVRKGYDLKYPKCEAKVITAICKGGCEWKMRASVIQNSSTYQVKTLKGEHTCSFRTDNHQADYKYLGERILDAVRDNPNANLESLKNKIKTECGIEVSMHKVYRAKRHALSLLTTDISLQFKRLYDYCATVEKYNPRSTMVLKVERSLTPPKLQRMYMCLAANKEAWLAGCRPIIGLDGSFLKGVYGGQLLSAVGRDGNDNMYPIAVAFVEVEKFDSWDWFLNLLLRDIGSAEQHEWVFVSDRQKGLIQAIKENAPHCEHRYCVKHMYNNFKVKFGSLELKKLFWKAASTFSVKTHQRVIKEIEKLSPKKGHEDTAFEWLCKVPTQHWARCFFKTQAKCDVIVNNISESFNNYVLPARDLPIIDMFEWIRKKLMTRIQVKRSGMERYTGNVCPNIIKKMDLQRKRSRQCYPSWAGAETYEVQCLMDNHIVNLKEQFCTCGFFQLCGYPCCHALACISYHRLNVEDYIHEYFKKDLYLKVYDHMISPVPGMHDFEDTGKGEVGAPDVKPRRGRPTKKRRPDGNDTNHSKASRRGLTHTCKICGALGHNKRTCPKKSTRESREQGESGLGEQPQGCAVDNDPNQLDHDMLVSMVSDFDTNNFPNASYWDVLGFGLTGPTQVSCSITGATKKSNTSNMASPCQRDKQKASSTNI